MAGTWFALIDGFAVHGAIDDKPFSKWELTVKADGEVIELDDSDDDDDWFRLVRLTPDDGPRFIAALFFYCFGFGYR
ncbi:MAG: hypothetical protein IIA98_06075 [Proteobacteria bacterium]|nr:hypothetical protein [Pseudomonadota bacterium]